MLPSGNRLIFQYDGNVVIQVRGGLYPSGNGQADDRGRHAEPESDSKPVLVRHECRDEGTTVDVAEWNGGVCQGKCGG